MLDVDLERIRDLFIDKEDDDDDLLGHLDKSYRVVYRCSETQPSDLAFKDWMNLYTETLAMLNDIPKYLPTHFFESGGKKAVDLSKKNDLGRRGVPVVWLCNLLTELGYREEVVEYYSKKFWTIVFKTDKTEGQLWRLAKSAWNGALLLRLGI